MCDKCGKDGERYLITFPDGSKVLDRCPDHAKAIEKFRDEKGEWIPTTPTNDRAPRHRIRATTPDELRAAVARGKGK